MIKFVEIILVIFILSLLSIQDQFLIISWKNSLSQYRTSDFETSQYRTSERFVSVSDVRCWDKGYSQYRTSDLFVSVSDVRLWDGRFSVSDTTFISQSFRLFDISGSDHWLEWETIVKFVSLGITPISGHCFLILYWIKTIYRQTDRQKASTKTKSNIQYTYQAA
jgi:hypothetical protein